MKRVNIDPNELHKFAEIAASWWDTSGHFQALHDINPLRMQFIQEQINLSGLQVLDLGCGGGILSESLAKAGAIVTGIDISAEVLQVARLHALDSELEIKYLQTTAEEYAATETAKFDVITCLEMLEHVPDPASIIAACSKLIKPEGAIFLSTLNRTPISYLQAILGAEYLLDLLPIGTHEYGKFIRPAELAQWLRAVNLQIMKMKGLEYNLGQNTYYLSDNIEVNYLVYAQPALR